MFLKIYQFLVTVEIPKINNHSKSIFIRSSVFSSYIIKFSIVKKTVQCIFFHIQIKYALYFKILNKFVT